MSKIGCIGTGNMGGALARAIGKSGHSLYLSDFYREKAEALAAEIGANTKACDTNEILAQCDMIFLGVKPQMLPALAEELREGLSARSTPVCLVSMAAGVSLARLAELFGKHSLIRIMPNTPAAVGAGMILACLGDMASDFDRTLLCSVLENAGRLDVIDEKLIDAASAVSGCGPAFVCQFVEAMADGGVRCGLPRDKALIYAIETLKGTAQLLRESGKHPGTVKDEVCSPSGSTIEGVTALEEGGLRGTVIDAITAAYERTLELGK